MTRRPKLVLLGLLTRLPYAGVVWQIRHYLEGFARLGFDVHYVDAHGSMPLAFFTIWIVSVLDRSRRATIDRAGYADQRVRSETGIGATGAHSH